jgi:two-component system LytT family response regulator
MTDPKLRVLVVDDEAPARALLRVMLGERDDVELVGECADGFEAVKQAGDTHPDVILLDVQMPKLDGFEVVELIGDVAPVVFVTAYDQYAIRAFEVNAVDYLLKPFDEGRLGEALGRARERLGRPASVTPGTLAAAARGEGRPLTRVVVKDGGQIRVFPVETIDYLEAQGDYVAIHAGKEEVLKQQTLQSLEESLDPARFVRTHRSYLVQLDRIDRIEPYGRDSRVAVLKDGSTLPVSRSGYVRLKDLLR